MRELNWLVNRLNRSVRIRNRLRTTKIEDDMTGLNYDISVFAETPWADYINDEMARIKLLDYLCPGWIHVGDTPVGKFLAANVGCSKTGMIRGTQKISNPIGLSLLTLIFETHIYLIGEWIEGFLTGSMDIKKLVDEEFKSPYKGFTEKHPGDEKSQG